MLLTDFRVRFPEFGQVDDSLVEAALDEAELELSTTIFRTQFDAAHGALTAHKLALSPYGQAARMVAKDGSTTYEKHFNKLKFQNAGGFRVA